MINFFRKRSAPENPLPVDIHSHLLPGIDDGVKDINEALEVIKKLVDFGYKKLITTPHINNEFFPNTPEIITEKYNEVKNAIREAAIDVEFEAAAEYFLDETLMEKIEKDEPLLTFGNNHLLFECSFLNEPLYLKEFLFNAQSKGYKLVLAHPERYAFVQNNPDILDDLKNRSVLLQVNMMSLTGHYNKQAKKIADRLIKKGHVDLIGSDCHNPLHVNIIREAINSKSYRKALDLPLLNYQL
ncbi:MAG: tyrosine-protein phosphatase [Candidatus Cyclobacteriaceae bacterium M2_1C_046]